MTVCFDMYACTYLYMSTPRRLGVGIVFQTNRDLGNGSVESSTMPPFEKKDNANLKGTFETGRDTCLRLIWVLQRPK